VGYFPADKPGVYLHCGDQDKATPCQHYGGQLAAPVFKEIVSSVYAQYGRERNAGVINVVPDSSSYIFSGNSEEMQQVLRTLKIRYADSMTKGAS
jgi:cell division protein FtsI (penicillin-binding protein 3)